MSGRRVRRGAADAKFPLDDFELYALAREFRRNVYRLIRQLPPAERYCLDPQIRKAAVSITNNIAEGHGRWHYQENIQFCRIARGSLEEIADDLNISSDEGYGDQQLVAKLQADAYVLIARVNGYIAYLRKSRQGQA